MEEIISVPAITAITYMLIEVLKLIFTGEKFNKLIPLISCVSGIALGIVTFYACPTIIVANNVLSAILVGGASGLGATGTNQIVKQLQKSMSKSTTDETLDNLEEPENQDQNTDKNDE